MQDLVLTRARRVLNAQGAFEGVVATDVSLRALNDVVNELGRSVHGLAFVIEPSGDLVAVSGMPNTRFADAGRIERTSIHSPDNHLVKSIYLQIRDHFDGPLPHANEIDSLSSVRSLRIQDQEVGPIHVAFVRITDQAGLDWMAAVAVPRATILSNVSRMVEWVVIAGVLCLLLTLVIGMRLFGSIADEVRSLSEAVKRAGHSGPHAPSPQLAPHRTDEVSELARNFSRMRHKLFTDHLTGISNRNALQHALANLMSAPQMAPSSTPFALLFIDLDLFKQLNDRWGHDNGDLALAEVAQRLRNHLRAEDHVARLGGDEFVVVLRGVEQRAAAQAASAKLAELICAPLATLQDIPAGVEVRLGASIGVALYPHDAHDVQGLLRHADQQMYAQKSQRPA